MKPIVVTIALLSFLSSLDFRIGSAIIPSMVVAHANDDSLEAFPVQAGTSPVSEDDSRVKALIQAVRENALDKVKSLLDQGVNVDAQDNTNTTPLMSAAETNNLRMLKALIKAGANINMKNKHGNTPLMSAALYGGSEAVTYLFKEGAEINAQTEKLQTALMFAAMRGDQKVAKVLLEKGASINQEDGDRFTALTYAIRAGHEKVARLLIAVGAFDPQPNLKDLPRDSSSSVDRKPKLLNIPRPIYTEEARRNRIEGMVRVRVIVGADGTVKAANALTTLPHGLTEMAISAAMNLKFEPAMKDGKPVAYALPVEVNFNLRR
ncbi:MAG: TonB family protein [Acidobacteriota bacterium]